MNQSEFDAVMQRLSGTYTHQETSKQLRAEMHRVLGNYSATAVERAVDTHIERSEFYPKPSHLLELIDKGAPTITADCGVCDGTGWIETTAPELDAEGNPKIGTEQPWVYKCKVCKGSGRGHG